MNEISLAITAIKTALELAKGLSSLSKDVAVQQKAAELLGTITDLNDKILNLQNLITQTKLTADQWEQKALKREEWDKTKSTYSTYNPTPQVHVYIAPKEGQLIDQAEWYCKNCADIEMLQSTFQLTHHSAAGKQFSCHNCGFKFLIPEKSIVSSHQVIPPFAV